ncbi:MAG: superoxide dismutase [Gammaproteobacteria bacterium]
MPLEFYDLPYPADALQPHIDKTTMEIHHGKHHRAYYDKMTEAVAGTEAALMGIERVLANVGGLGPAVRNNAGGYYNHNIYWSSMSPNGGGDPAGALGAAVAKEMDGADALRKEMTAAGIGRFGSGFAWLIVQDKKLKVVSTPNQDNPLMKKVVDDSIRGIPVLALDVWEHAYYLNYQNRRPDYIKAFWNVADWQTANKRYEEAMSA